MDSSTAFGVAPMTREHEMLRSRVPSIRVRTSSSRADRSTAPAADPLGRSAMARATNSAAIPASEAASSTSNSRYPPLGRGPAGASPETGSRYRACSRVVASACNCAARSQMARACSVLTTSAREPAATGSAADWSADSSASANASPVGYRSAGDLRRLRSMTVTSERGRPLAMAPSEGAGFVTCWAMTDAASSASKGSRPLRIWKPTTPSE
jgi:hypothetical protein